MKKLKFQQICEAIRIQIAEGFWKSRDKIYSERQLADFHNVSRPTVKRALSELVSEGLIEYREGRQGLFVSEIRNTTNSSGINAKEQYIGVAVDNHTPAFASHLLQGIHEALWDNGFHTLYCNTYHSNEQVFDRIQTLLNSSIAGIIFSPVLGPGYVEANEKIIEAINKKKIPFVLVDRYINNHLDNHVVINNQEIFHEMVSGLIGKGHSRILFIKGFEAQEKEA